MKIEHMTIDEILTRIEQGLVDEVPSDIAVRLWDDGAKYGYEEGYAEGIYQERRVQDLP